MKTSLCFFSTPLLIGIWAILSTFSTTFVADPVVITVSATQRPGTKFVDITSDITAVTPTINITLRISSDDSATFSVPATTLTGAVGSNVSVSNGKVIHWNTVPDWLGGYSTAMRFEVTADDGRIALSITKQPSFALLISGQSTTLTVDASDTAPLTYQWYQGAVDTTITDSGLPKSAEGTTSLA